MINHDEAGKAAEEAGDAGLYLHIPYCRRKCRYCAFVSYPSTESGIKDYLAAVDTEMELAVASFPELVDRLRTIYIGGGTPTVLSPKQLERLLTGLYRRFGFNPKWEITVEANPGTLDYNKARGLKDLGVNRLSLGAQSFDQSELNLLGRIHTPAEVARAVNDARRAGFTNINLDLISGLPGQTRSRWRNNLREAVRLVPEHLAAYSLKIEEGTMLTAMVERGEIIPVGEDLEADFYEDTVEVLTACGYEHYEISNFARPGSRSRHNLLYWRYQSYLGLGPAAWSFIGSRRWENEPDLSEYTRKIGLGELPIAQTEPIDQPTRVAEALFMGLRLTEGLDLAGFAARFGVNPLAYYVKAIDRHIRLGLLQQTGDRLVLTRRGLLLANQVFTDFLP